MPKPIAVITPPTATERNVKKLEEAGYVVVIGDTGSVRVAAAEKEPERRSLWESVFGRNAHESFWRLPSRRRPPPCRG